MSATISIKPNPNTYPQHLSRHFPPQPPLKSPTMTTAVIISCCNPRIAAATTTTTTTPNPKSSPPRPRRLLPVLNARLSSLPFRSLRAAAAALRTSALIPALIVASPLPALAEEVEKASLFDFNLTLPIMMAQFLLLMVALDKIYFTPLGKFMDERDAAIREKLNSVKDTSAEVKELEEQGAAVMRAARAEIAAALGKMKKETQEELDGKLAEARKKVEAELQEALGNLERQKEETVRSLDSQIAALSQEIVRKVLPVQ